MTTCIKTGVQHTSVLLKPRRIRTGHRIADAPADRAADQVWVKNENRGFEHESANTMRHVSPGDFIADAWAESTPGMAGSGRQSFEAVRTCAVSGSDMAQREHGQTAL
eukprot:2541092-Rhodomonas_salina.1